MTPQRVVFQRFMSILRGSADTLVRQTNLVQALGCLSTMAFVDKSGILAEPSPEPAKLLLFDAHNKGGTSDSVFGGIATRGERARA